jgi:glycine hydroxymethyltransferase
MKQFDQRMGRAFTCLTRLSQVGYYAGMNRSLSELDPDVAEALFNETARQSETIELIASENFVGEAILETVGSVFTNKYAEGYPGRRYYGGCEFVDVVESLAIERAQKLFGAEHVNVQPHSGTQANIAAYFSVLEPGDKILGMNLSHGGHLTHGHPLNFSGRFFEVVPYGVSPETETIDYDALADLAKKEKPKLIVAGASAYSRVIEFDKMSEIAKRVGAFLMADIAHIAGLVATGLHPSPIPYADLVTSTTHKTLRGPRGGLIMCTEELKKAVNRNLFPGSQGGPLVHAIAAKAVCLKLAMEAEFQEYQQQVMKNAAALSESIADQGFRIVSGGTDNHLFLVDVFSNGLTGKQAEEALEEASITVNKNTIPFDQHPPLVTSGIRVGTPAVTTRGMRETEMAQIGDWIGKVLKDIENSEVRSIVGEEVRSFGTRFPIYSERLTAILPSV